MHTLIGSSVELDCKFHPDIRIIDVQVHTWFGSDWNDGSAVRHCTLDWIGLHAKYLCLRYESFMYSYSKLIPLSYLSNLSRNSSCLFFFSEVASFFLRFSLSSLDWLCMQEKQNNRVRRITFCEQSPTSLSPYLRPSNECFACLRNYDAGHYGT